MSLVQLRYFVAVAEEANVSRAARKLYVSRPPVTRQIKSLELELGTPLFERTRSGVTLLPAGRQLLTHARTILGEVDRAVVSIRSM